MRMQDNTYTLPPNCIAVTYNGAALCNAGIATDVQCVDFQLADLQELYLELVNLLDAAQPMRFWREPMRIVKAPDNMLSVIELLSGSSPATLLRFLYAYCLSIDRPYFSALLHYLTAGDVAFVEFMESHCLNGWSVARFAQKFSLTPRKFNILFYEKYGVCAKRWLLERRLAHAGKLLRSNSLRVLDIALECGFSNHAHFTDSFRKHFGCSPTQFRLQHTQKHPGLSHPQSVLLTPELKVEEYGYRAFQQSSLSII
ncbi:hypothetical protein GCM10007934_13830 [Mycoavidus cysteinexigens]|nr:hypothetical protein GCM10007934_13830 [Mycoavidus cysteinexigens]